MHPDTTGPRRMRTTMERFYAARGWELSETKVQPETPVSSTALTRGFILKLSVTAALVSAATALGLWFASLGGLMFIVTGK